MTTKRMVDAEAVKKAVTESAIEAAKATVLAMAEWKEAEWPSQMPDRSFQQRQQKKTIPQTASIQLGSHIKVYS